MIPISKALKIIGRETSRLGTESVALADVVGRILAADIAADTDLPPFDRSQMDGFAVIAEDTINAPVTLKIVGESAAGHGWHQELHGGEAVRIMTGAPVPQGADAVQKVELTNERVTADNLPFVEILALTKIGSNIVRRGSEVESGRIVLNRGEAVTANMIAAIASFGYAKVSVAKRPRVGILATGSEIVEVAEKPGRDQIRNSNSPMLKVLAEKYGAIVGIHPVVGDSLKDLKIQISKAVALDKSAIRDSTELAEVNPQSEILIITGGVSVGKYDLTKPALLELGAEIFFEKVSLKPGKPTVFAKLGNKLIFGLPGNPVSAAVTFELFVRPALMRLQGATATQLRSGTAKLATGVKAAKERDTYLPASLDTDAAGSLIATPLKWLGSSDFVGFARADALIFVPNGREINAGDVATVLFL